MKTQSVIWTALPHGRAAGGALRLSVFVSPRLWTNEGGERPTLSQFPSFVSWPSQPVEFAVRFGTAEPVPARIVGPAPRLDLWSALFDGSTLVLPYDFGDDDYSESSIRSYPARQMLDIVKDCYAKVTALSPTEHPSPAALFGGEGAGPLDVVAPVLGPLVLPDTARMAESFAIDEVLARAKVLAADRDAPSELRISVQAEDFHRRLAPSGAVEPPVLPDFDFHDVASSLGEYPKLLLLLGLVRELEVDAPTGHDGEVEVRIVPSWSRTDPDLTPATRCLLSAEGFVAAPRAGGAELSAGVLVLDPEDFDLMAVDIDSAAMNLNNLATDASDIDDGALHALRSGGISLTCLDLAVRLRQTTLRSKDLNTLGTGSVLNAEDLVQGYAVDAWNDDTQRWYPLCARTGTYTFRNTGHVETIADEGAVQLGVTSAADDTAREDLFLHESLVRWTGWSLVAPRPGMVINPEWDRDDPGDVGYGEPPSQPAANAPVPVAVTFEATVGTLPRLRYGTTYRLRCRAVDLAGNTVDFDPVSTPVTPLASEPLGYARLEPVDTPVVALRRPVGPGESVERVVLRSNHDSPPAAPAERHLLPPKASVELIETSGAVDTGAGIDRSRYALLAQLDAADLAQGAPVDPGTGQPYFDAAQIPVRYGFDPMAQGVTFAGLGADPLKVSYGYDEGRSWPDALPFRLMAIEGSGAASFDEGARVLTVPLPKGVTTTIRYSSFVDAADLPKLDTLLDWAVEVAERDARLLPGGKTVAQLRAELEDLATAGQLHLLTPYRELTLVHALRQPLVAPQFAGLDGTRVAGGTHSDLSDEALVVDVRSTARVDVQAEWNEQIDDPAMDSPTVRVSAVKAFEQAIPYGDGDSISLDGRHDFADTKHRLVRYSALATSRYAEYFAETVSVTLTGTAPAIVNPDGIVMGSEVVTGGDPVVTYRRAVDYDIGYETGTLTRMATGAIADDAEVQVRFVPAPVTRSSMEVQAPIALHVPSTSVPAAPQPVEVVPTFAWSSSATPTKVTSSRTGRSVRVYLERPWWSSGDDEQLGVVLPRPGDNLDALGASITRLGRDPIWLGGPTSTSPTVGDFPRAVDAPTAAVGLAEDSNIRVLVAPHAVAFDAERKLWYSDIELDPRFAYFPFLRLALARYQRYSVADKELSTVVLADFVQLTPDRTATVIFNATDARRLRVTLYGQSYRWGASPAGRMSGPSRVVVSVETSIPEIDGELGWEPVKGVNEFTLTGTALSTGKAVTWSGDVILPSPRGSTRFRLVFREYERFATDPGSEGPGRLVYADAIEI